MQSRSFLVAVLLTATLIAAPVHGNFLSDAWNGVKSAAAAPVRLVGWIAGQGVNSAVDPALDNAFGRLKDTTNHAIDRFDSINAARIGQIDDVAKERIKQLDDIAKDRINQVDDVLKKRLDETDRILDSKLNQFENIGTQLLDREAKILDENVTRVEDILDHSLDRLQDIETDAFDKVDAALQDQVPFAASQVARTLEWTAAIIVFIVVLVGFVGVELLRRIRIDSSSKPIWGKLLSNLSYVPRALLLVGMPMLFLFAVIQTGYVMYCNRADEARVARVEDAAHLLELAGDFKAATSFRKRAFALDGKDQRHYMLMRDAWLSAFWQRHLGQDTVELLQRLSYLQTEPVFSVHAYADAELQAAAIYIRASYTAESSSSSQLLVDIGKYKNKFVINDKRQPVLGKLVYMSEAKLILNDATQPIDTRLKNARTVINSLLSVQDYKRYAPGLVLRSQLAVHQLELDSYHLTPSIDSAATDSQIKEIETDVEAAFSADPNLARYVRFRSKPLPKELAANLRVWTDTPPNARNDLKDAQGKPLSGKITQQFDEYATELEQIVKPLIGVVDVLSRSKVERQIMYSVRSTLGEGRLKDQIDAARKNKRDGKAASEMYSSCSAVADTAMLLGKLQLAESWLNDSAAIINNSPDAFKQKEAEDVSRRLQDVRQTAGHPNTDLQIPRLTDVMFYVL